MNRRSNNINPRFRALCTLLLVLISGFFYAEKEDSLKQLLKNTQGIEKAKVLNALSTFYLRQDPKQFIIYNKEALQLCGDSLSETKVEAIADFANYLRIKGKTKEAKTKLFSVIKEVNASGRKNMLADAFSALSLTYKRESLYDSALYYSIEAEKIFRNRNDMPGLTSQLSNAAGIYVEMEDFDKAGKYYNEALEIATKNNLKHARISGLIGIGIFNGSKGLMDSAIYYFKRGSAEALEAKDFDLVSTAYSNLGTAYGLLQKPEISLQYYLKNYRLKKAIDSKVDMVQSMCEVGTAYCGLKKYDSALYYIDEGLATANSINSPAMLSYVYETYVFYYRQKGDFKAAFEYYEKKTKTDKKMFTEQKQNSLSELETLYEMDKKEQELKLRDEQILRDDIKLKQQKTVNISIIIGLILVVLVAALIYRNLQQSKKKNIIISEQKNQVEKQKVVIEEKQKEIVDSINYAKRIQKALLASTKMLEQNLNEHFVLYLPKDIVSGDFYWASKTKDGKFLLATADSTGHGVPGAMMSMLNIACLNEAVNERGLTNAGAILDYCREKIIRSLSEDGSIEGGSDGMDVSVIIFDKDRINYASANSSIFVAQNNSIKELEFDRMPVGRHSRQNTPFTEYSFEIKKGDVIYTLTDGFADQFGGENGKKFMKKQIREKLAQAQSLAMGDQNKLMENTFTTWKGNLEQIDDVTLIGIKI